MFARLYIALFTLLLGGFLAADPSSQAFFESRIRPVLVNHCYDCHSVEAGKSKGGLLLDSRAGIREGGDTGAAVVPGDPAQSLLLVAMRHEDPDLEMPPKKEKLAETIAADFEAWIQAGAVDPREATVVGAGFSAQEMEARKEHWSYHPLASVKVPEVADAEWPLSPIDAFVLTELQANHLEPSADADPVTLLRRLSFDLTGLPPTPKQAEGFTLDKLDQVVDEMLNSEGFGVKWGRHWLDVARFAESNGRESNVTYPHAWRYRDYVIDAVNADLPYDRFVTEQLAGDLLPANSDEERARLLIATGYLALGAKGLNEQNKKQFAADVVDEQIDSLSRGILASSIACARCHDHKSDPFTMTDYYALAGVFKSSKTYYGTCVDSENNNGGELITLPDLPDQLIPNQPIPADKLAKLKADLAKLAEDERTGKERAEEARANGEDMQAMFNDMLREALRIYWTRGGINGKLATVDDEGNPLPLCMGVLEGKSMVDSPIYERGEIAHPGETVERALPDTFGPTREIPEDESGRLELAEWLTHPDHPLTARVMANRVWRHLFGTGLVRTVDNFGHTGEAPSHPELLDYLALRLRDNGWSVKTLVREIVLSRTYRQSSDFRSKGFAQDPDNRLLWRMEPRRLDAEAIRDSMLLVSGQLDTSRRPGSLVADLNGQSVSMVGFNKNLPKDLDGTHYRSVYLPVFRDQLPDVLDLFDFAEPSLVTGSREETNVPLQALYLMNSEFVHEQAAALAERVQAHSEVPAERIRHAFQLCFNREPDPAEVALIDDFFRQITGADASHQWTLFCQSLLSNAEFRINN